MFGQLIAHLHKTNPRVFHLPKDIREYFVGVQTGEKGVYEEAVPQNPKWVMSVFIYMVATHNIGKKPYPKRYQIIIN